MTLEAQVKNLKFGVTIFRLNNLDFWQDRLSKVATSLGLKTFKGCNPDHLERG